MKIYTDIDAFEGVEYPVVTMGTFDGLHLGHQKIISDLIATAKKDGGETVVITFDPHPRIVLRLDSYNLKFINTQEEKIELLQDFGIDHLIIIPFTLEFSKMSSAEFVKQILVYRIRAKKLIIGYDHHFGNQREGNYQRLKELGGSYGFEVKEIPAQLIDEIAVSSTKIRKALENGSVKKANDFLGYKFSIFGKVIPGNRIGTGIGFPTANIDVEDPYKLIPYIGVYAVKALVRGRIYQGMLNIGFRPTINTTQKESIEINIFDFDDNIYGDYITIYFYERIRDEKKFDTLNMLKAQLVKDRQSTLKILNS